MYLTSPKITYVSIIYVKRIYIALKQIKKVCSLRILPSYYFHADKSLYQKQLRGLLDSIFVALTVTDNFCNYTFAYIFKTNLHFFNDFSCLNKCEPESIPHAP